MSVSRERVSSAYDYSKHRFLNEFQDFVYQGRDGYMHPGLLAKEKDAQDIVARGRELLVPEGIPPKLLPHPADQGLVLTPFDDFKGMEIGIAPQESIEAWKKAWEFNTRLANHPSRVYAAAVLEQNGFEPPRKMQGVIDKEMEEGMLLQLSDLGQNIDMTFPLSFSIEEKRRKQFIEDTIALAQVHRTELIGTGPFSFVGKKARSFVGLGAMPDINGSVLALHTAAKMWMLAEVPEVGVFSDPKRQAFLADSVLKSLTKEDPILERRSDEEKDFILDHWKSSVVGVLEVSEYKALKRAEELAKVGVKTFRIYGHTQGGDVVRTVQALRKEFKDAEIFASQITNVRTALACEYAGADAVIIGVGSGGRCTTADLSQLIPSNAVLAWNLRGQISIPVIGEGGAVDEPVIAALVGMSGVNGSGSVGGGTLESPGGIYYLSDGASFKKPYGGEASPRTKWLSDRLYPTGLPYFSEGDQGFKDLRFLNESMTQNVIHHWQRIVLGAVVLGVDAGPYVISEVQKLSPSPLYKKSSTTHYLQQTH